MSEKDKYNIEPEDKCLSASQIFDYIDIKLNASAMHAIEKHMLDCEMCSDAMEGLAKLKDRSKVSAFNTSSILNETEANASRKIISINHKIKYYSVAAGLVLIIVLGFLINKLQNQNESGRSKIALNTNKNDVHKPTIDPLIKTDTQIADAELKPVTSDTKDKITKQIETYKSGRLENNIEQAITIVDEPTVAIEETAPEEGATLNEDANNEKLGNKIESKSTPSTRNSPATIASEKTKKEENNTNDTEFKSTLAILTDSVKNDTGKLFPLKPSEKELDLCYENGFKILRKGDAIASLDFFDEVLKYPKHRYYQDAEWQKSRALIQLNRKEEAKMMLQKIITNGGNYKSLAEQELQKIQ